MSPCSFLTILTGFHPANKAKNCQTLKCSREILLLMFVLGVLSQKLGFLSSLCVDFQVSGAAKEQDNIRTL